MNIKKAWWFMGGVSWSPVTAFGSDLVFSLGTHLTKNAFVETDTGTAGPVTNIANDGDLISTFYPVGPNPFVFTTAAGTRPKYSTAQGKQAIEFTRTSSTYLRCINTRSALRKMSNGAQAWAYMVWVKLKTDASNNGALLSNGISTGTGGSLFRNAGTGVLTYQTYDAAVLKDNVSTVATIMVADGWVPVLIEKNGVGANLGRIVIGATTRLFTPVSMVEADMQNDFVIGGRADLAGTLFGDFYLAHPTLVKRAITAAEWTAFQAYNPSASSERSTPRTEWEYNIIGLGAANNDPVDALTNTATSNFGSSLSIDLAKAGGVTSVLYKTNQLNGYGVTDWAGGNEELDFTSTYSMCGGGTWLMEFVIKNRNASKGSEFMNQSSYIVITGSNYGTPNTEYFTVHPATGASGGVTDTVPLKNKPDGWNVISIFRDGSSFSLMSGNKTEVTATSLDRLTLNRFGLPIQATWEPDMQMAVARKINGYFSLAERQARIDTLNSLFNI